MWRWAGLALSAAAMAVLLLSEPQDVKTISSGCARSVPPPARAPFHKQFTVHSLQFTVEIGNGLTVNCRL